MLFIKTREKDVAKRYILSILFYLQKSKFIFLLRRNDVIFATFPKCIFGFLSSFFALLVEKANVLSFFSSTKSAEEDKMIKETEKTQNT